MEVWFQDEARIGQKNGIVSQWSRRGSRPRQPADQRYENAYAVCPARGTGAAIAVTYADTDAMQLHLNEISHHSAKGPHAILLLDRAGWHTTTKLDVPETSRQSFCPHARLNSIPSRTSGSTFVPTGSPIASSKLNSRSSRQHATPGRSSFLNQRSLPLSE